jgi:hypothetical protein
MRFTMNGVSRRIETDLRRQLFERLTTLDDGDAALTDDESDIGDLASVVLVRQLMNALMDIDARCDFLQGEFLGSGLVRTGQQEWGENPNEITGGK